MSLFDRVKTFYSKGGRADRREYWTWFGVAAAVFVLAILLATLFGDNGVYDTPDIPRPLRLAIVIPPLAIMLALAIKIRAVSIRRRNDAAIGGKLRYIRFVPFAGRYLDFLTLGFVPSVKGSNEHGPGRGTAAIVDTFGDAPRG